MADKKEVTSKNHSNQRSSSHTDTDRSSHRSTSISRRSGSHNRERSDQRSSTVTSQPDQGRSSSRSNQSSTSYRSRPRSVVTRIDEGPTEQTRSERRVTFDLPPRRRRRSVSRSRRTVYSRSESTQSSKVKVGILRPVQQPVLSLQEHGYMNIHLHLQLVHSTSR